MTEPKTIVDLDTPRRVECPACHRSDEASPSKPSTVFRSTVPAQRGAVTVACPCGVEFGVRYD